MNATDNRYMFILILNMLIVDSANLMDNQEGEEDEEEKQLM